MHATDRGIAGIFGFYVGHMGEEVRQILYPVIKL